MIERTFWFLLTVCFFFFILRLPSLIEPYWYGDEGIYHVVGSALRDGRILYEDIWDNKPPLLYIMYAIFGPDQFSVRLISLVFGIGAVIVMFFLTKQLFKDSARQFPICVLTTSIFAFFFAIPFLEGNIANAENFMLFPIVVSACLIFLRFYFVAGILLGIAFLFKFVAVFDLTAFLAFLTLSQSVARSDKRVAIRSLLLGFILPFGITIAYFWANNALSAFFQATLSQNVAYVGYKNKLFIGQGLLIAKIILLFAGVGFVILRRKILSDPVVFVLIWVLFSLFNTFFSQRAYTHYVLVLLPSFSLAVGTVFLLKKSRNIGAVILTVVLIATIAHFKLSRPQKIVTYYQNFLEFITHKKNVQEYLDFFDSDTPRDYLVADYLRSHSEKKDIVFIWGNSAQIYTLSGKLPPGKYTVAYHISSQRARAETKSAMERTQPRYIVILPDQSFPLSLTNYREKLIIRDTIIYERIF